ncbi:MAG: DNA adenine methylase [Candidatus Lokiarchaeota archaeon]|nr:DNA adenine methylase [Candidatus Lokiarchaeota archaeon]
MDYINPPFNYSGSKLKLLNQILPLFDYNKDYFIDIFTGGGSVYVNILDKYEKVLINDVISDLIGAHKKLANNPLPFIESVKLLANTKDDQILYNELRESYNLNNTPEGLFALTLTCQNNMLRFNKKGKFNQTWGKRGFSDSTQKKLDSFVSIVSQYKDKIYYSSVDFYDINPTKPSMIYLDPPYTNTEAGYNSFWSIDLENKLYTYIKKLDQDGHSFALSGLLGEHKNNKKSEIIYNLIDDGYNYTILDCDYEKVARNKNSKNSQEVLIYNYNV